MVSIIRQYGANPKWTDLSLPVGRTVKATQLMYHKLVKSTDAVPMVLAKDVPAFPARGMGSASNGTKGTKAASGPRKSAKGMGKGNKRNLQALSASDNESDDTKTPTKKRVKKGSHAVTDDEIAGVNDGESKMGFVKKEIAEDVFEGYPEEA